MGPCALLDQVLTKASRERMFTPVKNDYGYGVMVAPMLKHKQIGHGGGINGFSTMLARFPDDDATVIVLSNNVAANTGVIAHALVGALFGEAQPLPGEQKEVTLDSKILDRYTGEYTSGPLALTVSNEGGHLKVQLKGQPKFEAFASSETQFFLKVVDAQFTFAPGDGPASEVRLEQNGNTVVFKRVSHAIPLAGFAPQDEVRGVLDAQVSAWNRGDVRGFMQGYEDSPDTTFVGSKITKGHAAVLQRYLTSYPTREKMGTLRFSDLEIQMLDSNYASVVGRFHLDRDKAAGGEAAGIFTLLFRRTAQGWKVILDHTS